jgi:hypothetical protein
MQGQVVHRTGSTRMDDRGEARYAKIYFYGGEEAASIRNANNQNRLDEGLLAGRYHAAVQALSSGGRDCFR